MKITSLQNNIVKRIVKLRSRSYRERERVLLIEGLRAVERALDAEWRIDQLLFCPELAKSEMAAALVARCRAAGIESIEFGPDAFRKMAYRDNPEGLLALGMQAGISLERLELGTDPLILIAEGVEKPGNLGAMLRVADGAGADALILADGLTDINNPNVVRASVGAIFTVPIVEAGSEDILRYLRSGGIKAIAALPAAAENYTKLEIGGPLAVVVGAEGPGLTRFWTENADFRARIPMLGRVDSLNVSVSAAIILYEALRQRGSTSQ